MTGQAPGPRDYVVDFAAKHTWAELWPKVMQSRAALLAELVDVSDEQAARRPVQSEGEDAWNMLQVLQHVLTYTRNVAAIIASTGRGKAVAKDPPGAIHDVPQATMQTLLEALVEASSDLAGLYRRLPAEPDLETRVSHPSFGPFNCREWFLFLTVHDDSHRRQIVALKQQG
jgi:uncharacterized damage-inducible protein DinB